MVVDETLAHQSFGLSGRALCMALSAKYGALTIYGIWAAIVELPTFTIIASSNFAIAWGVTVAIFAALAFLGVSRSWGSGRFRLEKWTTAGFILGFTAYSFALGYRAVTTGSWDSAPLALIPVALCVLPTIRYYDLVRRGQRIREKA